MCRIVGWSAALFVASIIGVLSAACAIASSAAPQTQSAFAATPTPRATASSAPTATPIVTPVPTPLPTPIPPPTPSPSPSPLAGLAPPVMVPGATWTGPGAIPILMYHYVRTRPPADELERSLTVTEADFSRQVSYLRCAGYYSITLTQLYDAMQGGSPLPQRPVVLTFDDGYVDAYTNAFPLLRSAGLGGTFGIVTDWVGQPGYMNWDQLREMAAAGMEIISHSTNHPDLGLEQDAVVRDQLSRSKRVLEEQLGLPVPFFIYPAGEPFRFGTPDRQAQVSAILQETGYRGALTTRSNMWQDPSAPLALSRIRVAGGTDIQSFAANMWGPPPDQTGC